MKTVDHDELTLTFRVPETDFDGADVEIAATWVLERLKQQSWPQDDTGGCIAYRTLRTIYNRYVEAVQRPEWQLPALEKALSDNTP